MSSASMETLVKVTSQQTPHRSAPLTADSATSMQSTCSLTVKSGGPARDVLHANHARRHYYQSYGDTRALAPSLELWTRSQSVVSPPTQLIDG